MPPWRSVEVIRTRHSHRLATSLLCALSCVIAVNFSPSVVAAQRQDQAAPVTARELERFDHINALARRIQHRYSQAFAHADGPHQARRVAQEMDRAITRMFRRQGMSAQRYRHIRHYVMKQTLSGSRPMVAGTTSFGNGGS